MRSSATGSWPPQKRVIVALGLPLLAGLGVWLLVETDPAEGGLLLPCLFHQLTGLYCIGCGTDAGPVGPPARRCGRGLFLQRLYADLAGLAGLDAAGLVAAGFGRRILPQAREPRWLLILFLISALLFLVLRNLPWPPFTFLAP